MQQWKYNGERKFARGNWLYPGMVIEHNSCPGKNFELLNDTESKKSDNKKKNNLDVNGDGVYDKKDISIMASELGKRSAKNKKKKGEQK